MRARILVFLLALFLLTGCAAPRYDFAAGEIFAQEGMRIGMPMEDVPKTWKQESGAPVTYAGVDFTGRLDSELYAGIYSDEVLLQIACRSNDTLTEEQVQSVHAALERDYGVELLPIVEDPHLSRWFCWGETGCLVMSSMGAVPNIQTVEIICFLQDYQDHI